MHALHRASRPDHRAMKAAGLSAQGTSWWVSGMRYGAQRSVDAPPRSEMASCAVTTAGLKLVSAKSNDRMQCTSPGAAVAALTEGGGEVLSRARVNRCNGATATQGLPSVAASAPPRASVKDRSQPGGEAATLVMWMVRDSRPGTRFKECSDLLGDDSLLSVQ